MKKEKTGGYYYYYLQAEYLRLQTHTQKVQHLLLSTANMVTPNGLDVMVYGHCLSWKGLYCLDIQVARSARRMAKAGESVPIRRYSGSNVQRATEVYSQFGEAWLVWS